MKLLLLQSAQSINALDATRPLNQHRHSQGEQPPNNPAARMPEICAGLALTILIAKQLQRLPRV
ncbi:hypothetical protein P3339_13940 [Microbulbifer sp. MLAF003]|uniref:hypothetical protein n=1 Tax=unclassified Microbulbifer TaxID=2619833 RepID=UPI0024AE8175|nr:hypothetical protein [Microbulbifer sp. MLAF003]WHI49571.1 hypothetical protein P3339_13940 [Microbulbifer sp. MLAF003]